MAFAALFSLALFAQAEAPATFQLAQADPAPAEGPMQTGRTAEEEARAQAAADGDPLPQGAPADDYGFVAWCAGALSGHMSLKERVWPEVDRIERQYVNPETPVEQALAAYDEQMAAGKVEMTLLETALDKAEAKGLNNGVARADAVAKGQAVWQGADTASTRNLAQLWMSWSLPSRCEATAKKIAG